MSANRLAEKRLVFIGGGNMAEALIRGALAGRVCEATDLTVTDIVQERLDYLHDRYLVKVESDHAEAVRNADIVFLAVKPQSLAEALRAIRPALPDHALVISIVAGVRCSGMEAELGEGQHVVRVMPNTPSLIGMGAAAVAPGAHATDDDVELAMQLMGEVGVVKRVEEDLLDAVTAVSGSGPAYVLYLIESMIESAVNMGLEPDTARELVVQTVEGSARLVRETGEDPRELRQKVTSKGGTPEAAIHTLDEQGVRKRILLALEAARARSQELSSL